MSLFRKIAARASIGRAILSLPKEAPDCAPEWETAACAVAAMLAVAVACLIHYMRVAP